MSDEFGKETINDILYQLDENDPVSVNEKRLVNTFNDYQEQVNKLEKTTDENDPALKKLRYQCSLLRMATTYVFIHGNECIREAKQGYGGLFDALKEIEE
ncbi:hypothetical protein KY332_00905 [Candidatus Woesearchaeota archaeon]|nr:hypothetical protein [Candidatus Woesearchaeota archaeon]